MSTNSVVAYLREDGSIVSSYIHYDGYETGVGMTLLEHYNSDELAERVSSAGYFSSLSEDMSKSLGESVHTEEADEFASMEEFELFLMENSHLEFGYLWTGGKWMVASWTTETIHAKPFTPEFGDAPRYESTWNGFSWLVTSFVREGRKTVERFRDRARDDNREGRTEYDEFADELEVTVDKWHRYGMGEIATEAMAA
tara:strand:+ start:647 stop:1240 length:594 start_codon:yes stop_codon:yes gene_type:complete